MSSILFACLFISCNTECPVPANHEILGFNLLKDLSGHWVGSNETAYGNYDWFAFDFRPISPSHTHSIYEGGTNQNIITSLFLANFKGEQKIMARNGGWLGNQYRATYFLLDIESKSPESNYYRLVDAVGGADRSYMEFTFIKDSIYIDAYKDNSGQLDQPIHHMGFKGANRNPSYSKAASDLFNYPQEISEVDFNGQFVNLIDNDSALFLEEQDDPFPKSDHGHLSDLNIDIKRNAETEDHALLLFISKEPIISSTGNVDFENLDNTVIRTISIQSSEEIYEVTYLHPDEYYLTVFSDVDNNSVPSSGDYSSVSTLKKVEPESLETGEIQLTLQIN